MLKNFGLCIPDWMFVYQKYIKHEFLLQKIMQYNEPNFTQTKAEKCFNQLQFIVLNS